MIMIYCCLCKTTEERQLTTGAEIYPHRPDLYDLFFWKCNECQNCVGCHKGTKKPLGNIATKELKRARQEIHKILDPIWKNKQMKRREIYREISKALGYEYHTGEIKTIEEARKIYLIVKSIGQTPDTHPAL
jgi:hypothetical protein